MVESLECSHPRTRAARDGHSPHRPGFFRQTSLPADNAPYAYTGKYQKPHALERAPSAAGDCRAVSPGTTIGKTLAMATERLDLIKQRTSLGVEP
jgi:hypothetical protein